MPHIGDYYWPDGLPDGTSHTQHKIKFEDQEGRTFYICYTLDQIYSQVNKWGYFSPYMPFFSTPGP